MKYKTIVIDPPWNVGNGLCGKIMQGGKFKPGLPYDTMSDEEILEFPIKEYADDNCSLFMWTTQTKLPAALAILEKWGFKYHACLTWDKESGICLNGFYRRTELVVFGFKGKFNVDVDEGSYIPTLIRAKANGHSKKPDIFYKVIRERTQEPRIDIFARKRHFGFDAFGDQVEKATEMPLFILSESNQSITKSQLPLGNRNE
jgi:N6-adenosine-specific RNA methylase IME4